MCGKIFIRAECVDCMCIFLFLIILALFHSFAKLSIHLIFFAGRLFVYLLKYTGCYFEQFS